MNTIPEYSLHPTPKERKARCNRRVAWSLGLLAVLFPCAWIGIHYEAYVQAYRWRKILSESPIPVDTLAYEAQNENAGKLLAKPQYVLSRVPDNTGGVRCGMVFSEDMHRFMATKHIAIADDVFLCQDVIEFPRRSLNVIGFKGRISRQLYFSVTVVNQVRTMVPSFRESASIVTLPLLPFELENKPLRLYTGGISRAGASKEARVKCEISGRQFEITLPLDGSGGSVNEVLIR